MNREFYTDIYFSPSNNAYIFISDGRYGEIPKIVIFQALKDENYFNLFLSDFIDDIIADDQSITNNGDLPKVMATVVQIIHHFTNQNPAASVLISGTGQIRKQLYARIFFNHYENLRKNYKVQCTDGYGLGYKLYIHDDKNYVPYAFLIKKK